MSVARRGSKERIVSDLPSGSSLASMVSVEWRIKRAVVEEVVRWDKKIFMILGGFCLGFFFLKHMEKNLFITEEREWLKTVGMKQDDVNLGNKF